MYAIVAHNVRVDSYAVKVLDGSKLISYMNDKPSTCIHNIDMVLKYINNVINKNKIMLPESKIECKSKKVRLRVRHMSGLTLLMRHRCSKNYEVYVKCHGRHKIAKRNCESVVKLREDHRGI
uniref:Uncharacterized protein n=1 Tax=Glossina austeni TaxID=7395 RepID=A0A1A9V7S4_GLOAU